MGARKLVVFAMNRVEAENMVGTWEIGAEMSVS